MADRLEHRPTERDQPPGGALARGWAALKLKLLDAASLRNVAILTLGTVISQVITVGASPVVTRFYDPAAFGVFGVFAAIVGVVSAGATLKLEGAIVLEKERQDALFVFGACLITACVISLAGLAVAYAGEATLAQTFSPELARLLLLYGPASVFVAGLYSGLQFWSIRNKRFQGLAAYQVVRSASVILLQVGCALAIGGGAGLVVGQLAGQVLGALLLVACFRSDLVEAVASSKAVAAVQRRLAVHKDFVLFGTPQSVLNAVSGNIPTLLLASCFGAATSGLFWLAYRLLMLPSLILTENLRSVLYQRLAELHHGGRDLRPTLWRSSLQLFALCLPVTVVLVLFGPWLFSTFFGPAWRDAGLFARIIAPAWLIQNAVVPFAAAVPILGRQKQALSLEIGSTILRAAGIGVGYLAGDASVSLGCFSLVGVVASAVLIMLTTNAYRRPATGPLELMAQ